MGYSVSKTADNVSPGARAVKSVENSQARPCQPTAPHPPPQNTDTVFVVHSVL